MDLLQMNELLELSEKVEIDKNLVDFNELQAENELAKETELPQLAEQVNGSENSAVEQLQLEEKKQALESLIDLAFDECKVKESINEENGIQVEPMDVENVAVKEEEKEDEFIQSKVIELARVLFKSLDEETQHYTKGCLWSADGTCLLVPVHMDGMHVYELPTDLYSTETISEDRPLSELKPAVKVAEGGTVYDVAWFPFMNSQDPNTCCWLATRQHEPIHLWDAFDGSLRCTYRGYDAVDEVEAAISVMFSLDAQQVFGGYKKSIKIFDTDTPGRKYTSYAVKQAVSCFAQNHLSTLTCGSWTGMINHYDLRVPKYPQIVIGGHTGGVTWLRYTTRDVEAEHPYMLFSGARKDNRIYQWDMRNHLEPVRIYERCVSTNQRIYFDFSAQENWLVSGNTDGKLSIWNIHDDTINMTLQLHNDCCNGVNLHPTLPIMATTSGQFHFTDVIAETDEVPALETETIVNYENALLLLWRGKTTTNQD